MIKKLNKKAQSKKSEIFSLPSKRGQEEMIGFGLIIILVAVILLVFLGISLSNSDDELSWSYEAENYIQSFLQYTSDCDGGGELLPVQDLIFECNRKSFCLDGRNSCEVLNSTLKGISDSSWDVGEDRPIKGYELEILSSNEILIYFSEGNITSNLNAKGADQDFVRGGSSVGIFFTIYS